MSQKKNDQLGMPFGTANARLKKNILFSLLVRLNDNVCFQCGKVIDTVEELSIEHKKPWLDSSPELFWDLNNIAFSHLSCNIRAGDYTRRGFQKGHISRLNKAADGYSICQTCRQEKPLDEFHKDKSNYYGVAQDCKICRSRKRNKSNMLR